MLTAAVVNTKIGNVDNKIPDVSKLVKKVNCGAKIKDIQGKYFTTTDYNKFMNDILDSKTKTKKNCLIKLIFLIS